jgi:hypothetical protein
MLASSQQQAEMEGEVRAAEKGVKEMKLEDEMDGGEESE